MEYQRMRKSKWDSQRVQKIFKNRHSKQDWDYHHQTNLNETGRLELKSFCISRQKSHEHKSNHSNAKNEEFYFEKQMNHIPIWICNRCTYHNYERNGYCSICQFSFKQSESYYKSNNSNKNTNSNSIDFGEYLKPILQEIEKKKDDMDECIQLAISLSLNDIVNQSKHDNNNGFNGLEEKNDCVNKKTDERPNETRRMNNNNNNNDTKYNFDVKKGYFTEKLEPSSQRKKTMSYHEYWREMNTFYSFFEANYNQIALRNKRNNLRKIQRKKKEELNHDDPNFPKGTKSLIPYKIWNFIPNIEKVRMTLQEQYNARDFYIRSIASPITVRRFLRRNGMGNNDKDNPSSNRMEIVYHGTASHNDDSIIRSGLVVGGTRGVPVAHGRAYGKGVYCSPNLGTAGGYQQGSMFICIARSDVIHKSGSIYVVPNDYDILPVYLASFKYGSCYSAPVPMNNVILIANHNFRPLNVHDIRKRIKRTVERKWSAYHKLRKYNL